MTDQALKRNDGHLVRNQQRLVAARLTQCASDRTGHALGSMGVGLSPGGTQRVHVVAPVFGACKNPRIRIDRNTFKNRLRLNEVVIMFDLKLIGKGGRRCTHLGTQQGRGNDVGNIGAAVDEILSDGLGHLNTKVS